MIDYLKSEKVPLGAFFFIGIVITLVSGAIIFGEGSTDVDTTVIHEERHVGETYTPPLASLDMPVEIVQQGSVEKAEIFVQAKYLEGTDEDGIFHVDENGRLIYDQSLLDVFNYYFSTIGRVDAANIVEMLRHKIMASLQEPSRSEALAFLASYQEFGVQHKEWMDNGGYNAGAMIDQGFANESMEMAIMERFALQQSVFGSEVAEQLWGEQYEMDSFVLKKMQMAKSGEWSEDMMADAPKVYRETAERTGRMVLMSRKIKEMRKSGASETDIYQHRELSLGAEAAQRLATLDDEREIWDGRIQRYLSGRSSILSDESLSEIEQAQEIQQLRDDGFDKKEQKRIQAYEINPEL